MATNNYQPDTCETSQILCPNSPESATSKKLYNASSEFDEPMEIEENINFSNPDRQSVHRPTPEMETDSISSHDMIATDDYVESASLLLPNSTPQISFYKNISITEQLQLRSADEFKQNGILKEEIEEVINKNKYKFYRGWIYSDQISEKHPYGIYMVRSRKKTYKEFDHCSVLLCNLKGIKYFDSSCPNHGVPDPNKPHNKRVQHEHNMTCAIHSLHMLHQISRGMKFEEILQLYSDDLQKNDNYVIKFFLDNIISYRISGEPSDCDCDN